MTKLKDEIIYDKVKQKIQHEINHTVTIINDSMQTKAEDVSDETITKLANDFIKLASCNGAVALLNSIKPTEVQPEE